MTTAPEPLVCIYEGDGAFAAASPVWAKRGDERFVVGERYMLEAREARSMASHNFYFASLNEAFLNLPEEQQERFPTADHLRRWCLIKTGWRDERSIVCASKAEAQRVAAFIRPMDDYAVVVARDVVVTVMTAKSQSMKAMGKRDFQKSKDDVLEAVAAMIKTSPGELKQNAGKAA